MRKDLRFKTLITVFVAELTILYILVRQHHTPQILFFFILSLALLIEIILTVHSFIYYKRTHSKTALTTGIFETTIILLPFIIWYILFLSLSGLKF